MFRVGLTGGIASGKSTLSRLFAELGIPVIDTDTISHDLMQPGHEGYLQAVQHFGNEILNADGTINRPLLRRLVFNQPEQKDWLEKMLHPLIREHTEKAIRQTTSDRYVLVVVPLMFETGFNRLIDHVVAIDCPATVQLERLTRRDNVDEELAHKMIASQMENQRRLALADSIIRNDNDENRHQDVLQLHTKLVNLAQKEKPY